MRLRKLVLGFLLLLACRAALALNPAISLAHLNHASWGGKDGVPSDVQCIAQTIDGWLWLGTADGLYRFDGVSFERMPFQFNRIYHLSAVANGDLLVSSMHKGMFVLHPDGSTTQVANDEDGFTKGGFHDMMAD